MTDFIYWYIEDLLGVCMILLCLATIINDDRTLTRWHTMMFLFQYSFHTFTLDLVNFAESIKNIANLLNNIDQSIYSIISDYAILKIRSFVINTFSTGLIVRNKHNKFVDLIYFDGDNKYKIRIPTRRGPRPFLKVYDGNDNDVTETINLFAGPYGNFHGMVYTPFLLGFEHLKFVGLSKTTEFNGDDIILLR